MSIRSATNIAAGQGNITPQGHKSAKLNFGHRSAMPTGYQIFAINQAGLVLLVPTAVSVCYYMSARTYPTAQRLLWAAHGVLLLIAFAYAVAVSPWSDHGRWGVLIWPFWILLGLFVVALAYSVIWFQGNRAVHFLQLLQVPSAAFIWLIGTMVITHDWI
jgi:hypothetical protein